MRRLILWDFPRTSWQYDLIVIAILAFIFLTPRNVFRDQPRAASVVLLPGQGTAPVYWIEPGLLSTLELSEGERLAQATRVVQQKTRRALPLTRVEPIFDAEQELKGYMAFTKP